MRFPLQMSSRIAGYVAKKKLSRAKKFPMVLMLEPLHACNLTCTGCGRIREYSQTIKQKLSIDECLAAVDECGSPVVSICGGEPMIYPGIGELTAKILERKKVVYNFVRDSWLYELRNYLTDIMFEMQDNDLLEEDE